MPSSYDGISGEGDPQSGLPPEDEEDECWASFNARLEALRPPHLCTPVCFPHPEDACPRSGQAYSEWSEEP